MNQKSKAKTLRSKKGYTLVELVVTIAILSIVSTMGIGIFAMTITHYTTAATTSKQQDQAVAAEQMILEGARTAKEVYFISGSSLADGSNYPDGSLEGNYIGNPVGTKYMETFLYQKNASGTGYDRVSDVTLEGIQQITFKLRKQVPESSDPSAAKKTFVSLEYTIETTDGYQLQGSTVLNNIKSDAAVPGATLSKIPTTSNVSATYTVGGSGTANTAIVFGI